MSDMSKNISERKYAAFGDRLRRLRKANGYTQEGAATQLNVERSTYTKYETGDSMPHQETLLRLAELFHVSVDYLLGNTASVEPISHVLQDDGTLAGLSAEDTSMLLTFRRLTPEQQQSLLNIAYHYNALNATIKAYKPQD